ncbi:hypothetical protein WJX72_006834 [[Myrmecia] bisecta]|uniref:ER membrane protein complex subunit 1 n=1 Tax=[Myrmecia] bisecta TaxID=41462 RepID=A0AAW1PPC3_9CHLO
MHQAPPEVAVLSNGNLQVISSAAGKLVWRSSAGAALQGTLQVAAGAADGQSTLTLAALDSSGQSVKLVTFASKTGDVLAEAHGQAPTRLDSNVLVRSGVVVALSSDGKKICSGPGTGIFSLSCEPISGGSPASKLLDVGSPQAVVVTTTTGHLLLKVDDRDLKLVAEVKGSQAVSKSVPTEGDQVLGFSGNADDGSVWTRVISIASGKVVQEGSAPAQLQTKDAAAMGLTGTFLGTKAGDSDVKYRSLVVAADHTLLLVEAQRVVWRREEALASASAALFVDLPAPGAALEAQYQASKPPLQERLRAQLLTLKVQFNLATPEEKALLSQLQTAFSDRLRPNRDPNGFRKMLVVLTQAGKLFGLHTGDGHVMWSITYSPAAAPQSVRLWRSSHDVYHAPEVVLLHSGDTGSFASVVNTHTGREISNTPLPYSISQVVELPQHWHDGTAEQRVFLLVSGSQAEPQVHLLPASPPIHQFVASLPTALNFWTADVQRGVLSGYAIDLKTLATTQLWSVVFPTSTDTILALAARDAQEQVYSHIKILGDYSLKIKYMNPNTLFVATGPPDGVPTAELPLEAVRLTVHILDTVTGRPLFRQTHQGARGPVAAVVCENWVVYSYYSVANHRNGISVLELYDDAPRNLTIPQLAFGTMNETLSSYSPAPLEVLRQSFFFGPATKLMAVTSTARGITSRYVLLGTTTDQVFMLDKRFVDPRRPRGPPTPQDQEERLLPYKEDLPLILTMFATHAQQVARLRGIVTAPANLESTSLMVAFGLDMFFTRIQPSATFDSLQDDFPYAMLVLLTSGLIAGALGLKYMDTKAQIKRKWE